MTLINPANTTPPHKQLQFWAYKWYTMVRKPWFKKVPVFCDDSFSPHVLYMGMQMIQFCGGAPKTISVRSVTLPCKSHNHRLQKCQCFCYHACLPPVTPIQEDAIFNMQENTHKHRHEPLIHHNVRNPYHSRPFVRHLGR